MGLATLKLDAKLSQALVNLRGNRDWIAVLEALKDEEKMLTQRCIDAEGSQQLRAAGAVKLLQELTKCTQDAQSTLEKHRSQPQRENA